MPLRAGQHGHCRGEEEGEDDEYADGPEGGVVVVEGGELVHCDDGEDEEDEDDGCDDEADEHVYTRRGEVVYVFVRGLFAELGGDEEILQRGVSEVELFRVNF